ncbi:SRPBCC family protein [Sphaerisporangium corydalis]|uniref:SRPBCC family protein n=1 Tax=Sphaerisporangium corydalis TaxID=1441875 RepID=A0ABV9EIM5_9ACTN|nr:SRPBCC family protein [Sphaerisporangium corydalis]
MLATMTVTEDGRYSLRFERRFRHPQAKVWRAITETERLREWFVQILDYDRLEFDLAPGAELTFVPKAEHAAMGTGHGTVTRFDPPDLLEYTWDSETLRWELTPEGDSCRMVFTTIFGERESGPALGSGWHIGLDLLAASLDGRDADRHAWESLPADYERVLG